MSDIIVGLDIGTSCVRAVICELSAEKGIEVIGAASRQSKGLRNGVIVNIDAAATAIRETIEEAELSAGVEVDTVYTAIGGTQAESQNTAGMVAIDTSKKNRTLEITEPDKARAIESAKSVLIPLDKKLLHVIPQEYIIDGTPGYRDPLGIMGVRLEVQVHLVTASVTAYANIDQCITRAGYTLGGVTLKTLAAAYATVHEEEMELGSIVIDLGGGTTDVMVINNGAPVFTTSIPVGGNLVTNDIALVRGISTQNAERIKVEHGCCWPLDEAEMAEDVIIPGIGGRPPEQITRFDLFQIIEPRVTEILKMTRDDVVHKSNLKELNGSIVLTGGGALMPGIVELAQSVWGTSSVRIGESANLGGADTRYRNTDFATAVGLVLVNKNAAMADTRHHRGKGSKKEPHKAGLWKRFMDSFFY